MLHRRGRLPAPCRRLAGYHARARHSLPFAHSRAGLGTAPPNRGQSGLFRTHARTHPLVFSCGPGTKRPPLLDGAPHLCVPPLANGLLPWPVGIHAHALAAVAYGVPRPIGWLACLAVPPRLRCLRQCAGRWTPPCVAIPSATRRRTRDAEPRPDYVLS